MRLRRFAACFVVTRVLESMWFFIAFVVSSSIEHGVNSPIVDKWEYWTPPDLGYMGVTGVFWYYIGFGYIFASGIVSFVAWNLRKVTSASGYGVLNFSVFFVHSGGVILFTVPQSLNLGTACLWASLTAFNATAPYAIWRIFQSTGKT